MKTYAEQKYRKPFNWNAFLDKALTEPVSEQEHEEVSRLSGNFITCACGNQCETIPRYNDGTPLDDHLENLGMDFYDDICKGNYQRAKSTLSEIEKRSAFLIKEQSGKQKKLF